MATKEFIFQGFTSKTHEAAVARLFAIPDVERVIISVAFVNRRGIDLLESHLKIHGTKTAAYIGIRNGITSWQGAQRLLDLGVSLFAVDTGSRNIVFHPKLYLVRSLTEARLVIGSANLTVGGLQGNIEAGIAIDLDLKCAVDRELIEEIEKELDALPKDHPKNVVAITKTAELVAMQTSGRLIDEMTTSPVHLAIAAKLPSHDKVPRIKLKVVPKRRTVANAKKPTSKPGRKKASAIAAPSPAPGVEYELVWESKPLTHSDLNISLGGSTNRKGSISLDKGLLVGAVDHRHYFRENVFPLLKWRPSRTPTVQEARAKFQLVIKGISYGEIELRIAHTKGTTSATYKQGNAMTRLGWGRMRDYVARKELLGRTLCLYRDKADPQRFMLEID